MKKKVKGKKKGAIELSMSTIVILVLAMIMLGLGIFLIRVIFKGATESVNEINDRVMGDITSTLSDQSSKIVVKLGSDHNARIKQDTKNFGVAIGARTDNGAAGVKKLKYQLSIDESARENCITLLGKTKVENFFKQKLNQYLDFDRSQDDVAGARIQIDIPAGTALCSQKVYIDVKEGEDDIGREFFTFEIIRKGLF